MCYRIQEFEKLYCTYEGCKKKMSVHIHVTKGKVYGYKTSNLRKKIPISEIRCVKHEKGGEL